MDNKIKIHLPISASFKSIEAVLKQKLINSLIPPQNDEESSSPYAQILDIHLEGIESETFNLVLNLKIKILRTILKRDDVDLLCYVAVDYNNESQQLFVSKFKLKSMTSSGFFNTSLEILANKVAYTTILNNSKLDVQNLLEKEKFKLNNLISAGHKMKGINLIGEIEIARVQDVRLQQNRLVLNFELEGNAEADFYDLSELIQ